MKYVHFWNKVRHGYSLSLHNNQTFLMAPFFHAVNLTTWKVLGFSKKCSLQAEIFLQAHSARRGAQTYAHTTKVWQISRHRKKNQETVSKGENLAAAEKVKKWRTKMAFSYSQVHFFALPKHHVICAAVSFFERIWEKLRPSRMSAASPFDAFELYLRIVLLQPSSSVVNLSEFYAWNYFAKLMSHSLKFPLNWLQYYLIYLFWTSGRTLCRLHLKIPLEYNYGSTPSTRVLMLS